MRRSRSAWLLAEKVLADFRRALAGDDLADVKITHDRLHAGAVLSRGAHVGGQSDGHAAATIRARLALRPIFGDLHLDGRQVENLTNFLTGSGLIAQIDAALRAGVEWHGHRVGGLALVQGLARVTGLATGFALAVFGALRFGPFESVAGGE